MLKTTSPESPTYGQRLRERREALKLTRFELAAAANLSDRSLARFELDEAKPSLESLVKLAEFFKCPISELMP